MVNSINVTEIANSIKEKLNKDLVESAKTMKENFRNANNQLEADTMLLEWIVTTLLSYSETFTTALVHEVLCQLDAQK